MKLIPDHVFRGYDLRGVVDTDLDEENVENLAKTYATWLIERRIYDCVVGYDCRITGPAYSKAIIKGLTESGITVYDIGMTLSQISYFAQYVFRTRGLVMITASHNPKEYNGFKLGMNFSETMLTEDINLLKEMHKKGEYKKLTTKGEHIQKDMYETYLADLMRFVPNEEIEGIKVVVDSCAATTGVFLPKILRAYGCEVIEQNTTPDGNFPVGTPDPTEREVQERLAERVVKEGADLGFSYDCDGDRMGVVDAKGHLIWNDTLVALYAQDVLDTLPHSKIVYNALCSKQVDSAIKKAGGEPIMWLTGHSFIKAKVSETRAAFGGELSGHFFFYDNFYGHEDGALATLRLLSYLQRKNKTLEQAVAELDQYNSSPEIKVGCPDDIKFDVVSKELGSELKKQYPQAEYVEIDGVRMDTEEEMIIFRASHNGPYLTIKFEARTQEKYDILRKQISEILHKNENIDFSYGINVDSLD